MNNLRARMCSALRRHLGGHKVVSAVRDLGCTMPELIQHLERQFVPGMSWDNHGNKSGCWSIDHIVPLATVNLTNKGEALAAVHYTNLRPLWHIDNLKKGATLL